MLHTTASAKVQHFLHRMNATSTQNSYCKQC